MATANSVLLSCDVTSTGVCCIISRLSVASHNPHDPKSECGEALQHHPLTHRLSQCCGRCEATSQMLAIVALTQRSQQFKSATVRLWVEDKNSSLLQSTLELVLVQIG